MPDMKRNFTSGKMNKDLDERLVPQGEYRDAMNVQVSSSEGSDVGAIQNVLGNVPGCTYANPNDNPIVAGSTTVGSIADEKNDTLYWLVAGPQANLVASGQSSLKDMIIRTNSDVTTAPSGCEPVFVDTYALVASNSSSLNSNIVSLPGLPLDLVPQIQPGWTITGYTDTGVTSNTVNIDYVSTSNQTSFEWEVETSTTPNYSITFVDPNNPQALGESFYVELEDPGTGVYDVRPVTSIRLKSDYLNATDLIGSTLNLMPGTANSQTFTVITAFSETINLYNSTGANFVGLDVITLILDVPLTPFTPAIHQPVGTEFTNPISLPSGGVDFSTALTNDYSGVSGGIINGTIVSNTPVYNDVPNGNLIIPSIYDVNNWSVGDELILTSLGTTLGATAGITAFISIIDIDPVTNVQTIAIVDSTGAQILPSFSTTPSGTVTNFHPQGTFLFSSDLTAQCSSDLVLSDNTYTSLLLEGPRVLNFDSNKLVTNLNIVDDMLFWTDGYHDSNNNLQGTEPKKINIERSISGTNPNGQVHTDLIVLGNNFGPIKEEHVTVIKKAPNRPPTLNMVTERDGNSYTSFVFDFTGISNEAIITLSITTDNNYKVGDILLIKEDTNVDAFPILNPEVRVYIKEIQGTDYICDILSIDSDITFGSNTYNCQLDNTQERLYKLKFPRFAIRYKYADNEYSTFGPFSEPAFIPGSFNQDTEKVSYLPNTGYNLGMENRLRELTLQNIIPNNIPKDVIQVDILYKESNSPSVYIIDEIKYSDTYWLSNSYIIKQESIKSVLPSNQLLRSWDNVPKKAAAQEVTGNRLIYANYEQNYDITNFRSNFKTILQERFGNNNFKSIKSLRNYQIGIIYADKYNRQTPVLTDTSGSLAVSKLDSSKTSQIQVTPDHTPPSWASHYKFYIKETSTEYYNLALDRYFDAEDGNVWLSFPSSDRDKLDLETTLYLKKRYNSNVAETTPGVYKIIDIKNEAPEFIKTRKVILGRAYNEGRNGLDFSVSTVGNLFEQDGHIPTYGEDEFKCNVACLDNTVLENFHKRHNATDNASTAKQAFGGAAVNNPLFVRIISIDNNQQDKGQYTKWYEIDNVSKTGDENFYIIRLKSTIKETWTTVQNGDVTLASDLQTLSDSDGIELVMEIAQEIVQNKSIFQGRFFAKILLDRHANEAIVQQGQFQNIQVIRTANVGYLKDFTQEDPFSGGSGFGGVTKTSNQNEITSFNSNGPVGNPGNYADPIPDGKPIPISAYWSFSTWQKIRSKLDAAESRWVIDEAFATGEEPLWQYHGGDNQLETDQLAWLYNGHDSSNQSLSFSKLYAGYHSQSTNDSTLEHNNTPIGQIVSSVPNTKGLGHGASVSAYEYYSEGGGIQPTKNTIDLSYIGPGETVTSYILNGVTYTTPYLDYYTATEPTGITLEEVHFLTWSKLWDILPLRRDETIESTSLDIAFEAKRFADALIEGNFIRFKNDPNLIVYEIIRVEKFYKVNYAEYRFDEQYPFADTFTNIWWANTAHFNRRITFRLTLKPPNDGDTIGTDGAGNISDILTSFSADATNPPTISGNYCPIEIVTQNYVNTSDDVEFPQNPAIFETEPKEDVDLDIFHEASDTIPLSLIGNEIDFAPPGTIVKIKYNQNASNPIGGTGPDGGTATVLGWNNNVVQLSQVVIDDFLPYPSSGIAGVIRFERPDGSYTSANIIGLAEPIDSSGPSDISYFLEIDPNIQNNTVGLGWYNCYSFGNGIESNRIRDAFNTPFIDKGPKVSTTLEEGYELEHRKYGLIYSGIYNSNSGVNSLNQFIQAEKITKDINPTYGSIQKLHSRNSDLVALCEDKVLKILANKDAVFNADGNTQLTATQNVLGQTIPFSGEYGISKNPESFASESYRAYFTDKVRGAVLRLSKDGLTPISGFGMKDWFRDNLKLSNKLIGSYDDKKDEYNISLTNTTESIGKSITFKENVKGWVSFKSFVAENGNSCANEYYTFKEGHLWKHHVEVMDPIDPSLEINRNTFYTTHFPSSFKLVFNDVPGSIKTFHTINYEGSQSKIDQLISYDTYNLSSWSGNFDSFGAPIYNTVLNANISDGNYYNLQAKKGWYIDNIETDLERGALPEFIEKEGKWFNYIRGKSFDVNQFGRDGFDNADSSIQGLGTLVSSSQFNNLGCTCDGGAGTGNSAANDCYGDGVPALNYNPMANADDGSCIQTIYGCTDSSADNYDPINPANTDDGSCIYYGCTDATMFNYDANANVNQVSATDTSDPCVAFISGCTDASQSTPDGINYYPNVTNYNPLANTDDGSCITTILGCTDASMFNYNSGANWDDNSCYPIIYGCIDPNASNYVPLVNDVNIDANTDTSPTSCEYFGCTDPMAVGYDPYAIIDDGSCGVCINSPAGDITVVITTTDPTQPTPSFQIDDSTSTVFADNIAAVDPYAPVQECLADGCYTLHLYTTDPVGWYPTTDITITNGAGVEILNTTLSGSTSSSTGFCINVVSGCIDPAASNYDATATVDDGSCVYDVFGCTDPAASNYDNTATVDDGTCVYLGCTDPTADNYDPNALTDDGSCTYPAVLVQIPNANFRTALVADNNNTLVTADFVSDGTTDGWIDENKINGITVVDVASSLITDLTGIEYFESLVDLNCQFNNLETLEVGMLGNLEILLCRNQNPPAADGLTTLGIDGAEALIHLSCSGNALTSLNTDDNDALEYLDCSYNRISSFDFNNQINLEYLYCRDQVNASGSHILTSIDVSYCDNLKVLSARNNNLLGIDVTNNLILEELHVQNNVITWINVSNNNQLTTLFIQYNNLGPNFGDINLNNENNTNMAASNINLGYQNQPGSGTAVLNIITDDQCYALNNWGSAIAPGTSMQFLNSAGAGTTLCP